MPKLTREQSSAVFDGTLSSDEFNLHSDNDEWMKDLCLYIVEAAVAGGTIAPSTPEELERLIVSFATSDFAKFSGLSSEQKQKLKEAFVTHKEALAQGLTEEFKIVVSPPLPGAGYVSAVVRTERAPEEQPPAFHPMRASTPKSTTSISDSITLREDIRAFFRDSTEPDIMDNYEIKDEGNTTTITHNHLDEAPMIVTENDDNTSVSHSGSDIHWDALLTALQLQEQATCAFTIHGDADEIREKAESFVKMLDGAITGDNFKCVEFEIKDKNTRDAVLAAVHDSKALLNRIEIERLVGITPKEKAEMSAKSTAKVTATLNKPPAPKMGT